MKKLYTFVVLVFMVVVGNAQIVSIPDVNLRTKLLAANENNTIARDFSGNYIKIDSNNNNQIEITEALNINELNVSNLNSTSSVKILNMTGLSAFSNVTKFYCFDNLLVVLDVTSLLNLVALGCDLNQIKDLNISGLVNLQNLSCEQNQIVSLDFTNKPNLNYINCLQNNLSSLNLTNLFNLTYLRASSNPYTSLDFTGLTQINSIQCMDTNISTLDVSNLENLETLLCGNNPNLINIFMKNGAIESSLNLSNLPNLKYVCVDAAQQNSIQNNLNVFSNATNVAVNTYCSFFPGGTYYSTTGTNKFDADNNGCDTSDNSYPYLKFSITNGTSTENFLSDPSGDYLIPVRAGTYTIASLLENPTYFIVTPSTVTVTFPTAASPFLQDYCVVTNGIHNDVEIILIPTNAARPGFDAKYKIIYKNKGTSVQSGSVNLAFDDTKMDFVAANPTSTSSSTNSLSWEFSNLQPLEAREILFTMNLNSPTETPAVNGGDILSYTTTIVCATDETPIDNTSTLNQTVVNSFDPNDKTCLEGTTVSPSMVGEYVHYLIRFENTGTFAAENIVVKDIIDTTKYDINSLVPFSGSSSYITRITNTNQVEFIFENINLPFDDANNDGYVAFKIKTKPTLVVGDTFSNSANIYFDYNFPIVTNTATTTVTVLGTQDFEFSSMFSLSPVPAKNVLTITTKQSVAISSVSIYNMLGQLVQVITNPNETIDVSSLKTGSYFIKIVSDQGTASSQFSKE